jgi:xanthine dehydrogenase YagS FAD-binding subunit
MKNFSYARAETVESALDSIRSSSSTKFLGGGTNLVDLMRENIEQPAHLVDVTRLPLTEITDLEGGGVRIGAGVRNSALAADEMIRDRYPMLSQAILNGASGQIRNMATTAGNLMQRTRCYYFYDTESRCNKRTPGAGCDAIKGFNRIHAVLGASEHCIATHPSDMCVALTALDAAVNVRASTGARAIPILDFFRLPGDTPNIETNLLPTEIITSVDLPPVTAAGKSTYRKIRDRASYAFALVSVAAAVWIDDGIVTDARIALGGVAHKPWRALAAEKMLVGNSATEENFKAAAAEEMKSSRGYKHNSFKIELAQRAIVSVLRELSRKG